MNIINILQSVQLGPEARAAAYARGQDAAALVHQAGTSLVEAVNALRTVARAIPPGDPAHDALHEVIALLGEPSSPPARTIILGPTSIPAPAPPTSDQVPAAIPAPQATKGRARG